MNDGPDNAPAKPRKAAPNAAPGQERRGSGRLFDYGELRLLLLAMIEHAPRHGYELIKAIEERFDGHYTPSPGVIYPTLSWLHDMGYAKVEAQDGGRKRYSATPEGTAYLSANRAAVDDLLARKWLSRGRPADAPAAIIDAMDNLKRALRERVHGGKAEETTVEAIAEAINAAADAVRRS